MAEPLAELGHIGLDTVDPFVEAGEVDAEEIENFVSHSNNPGFRREEQHDARRTGYYVVLKSERFN